MELNTDKARYGVGESVIVTIDLDALAINQRVVSLKILIKKLDQVVVERSIDVADASKSIDFKWTPPLEDEKGYLVEVFLMEKSRTLEQKNIAVDVSSSWKTFPRYGYLTDFSQKDPSEIAQIIKKLNRLHLNGFLFYDWQYKHHQPIPSQRTEDESWLNIANDRIYASTVNGYIAELHSRNMVATNYNLIYGAYEEFALANKEMGLYKDVNQKTQDKHDLPTTWASDLYLINPGDSKWQSHYLQMEKEVDSWLDFDVMHLDTLGNRGALFDATGKAVDLPLAFADFIENYRQNSDQEVLFNFVNEYAKDQVAKRGDVSFAYSELWPDRYPSYVSLANVVQRDQEYGLASVLALYMNYPKKSGQFNTPGVLLTSAVVLSSGGSILSMGDLGMLSSEYFPNDKLSMSPQLESKMIDYADFMVAYQNILRGGMIPVHDEINIAGVNTESQISPLSVWTTTKENAQYKTVHLVNLLNRSDLLWRDDSATIPEPILQKNLKLTIPYSSTIETIYVASPDFNGGSLEKLEYKYNKGMITLTVPELDYWSMILIVK
ncbi:MAG: glycoside hydrolase family 66 protein [Erysipelotrichaceae bacterium]